MNKYFAGTLSKYIAAELTYHMGLSCTVGYQVILCTYTIAKSKKINRMIKIITSGIGARVFDNYKIVIDSIENDLRNKCIY